MFVVQEIAYRKNQKVDGKLSIHKNILIGQLQ